MARLGEWLKVGGGIPGCMHGGGSPDGAKLVVRAMTKWEGLRRRIPHPYCFLTAFSRWKNLEIRLPVAQGELP
jgi:hypothetical protein